MKKMRLFTFAFCLVFFTFGCSPKTVHACLSFSEYYQDVDSFDEISPQLELYFSSIETAYENSDKKKLSSFTLPDEYNEAQKALQSFYDDLENEWNDVLLIEDIALRTTAEESYVSKLRLLYPYVQIESIIAEQKLILQTSPRTKDEEWFDRLNTTIKDSVKEYLLGTGEQPN